MAMEFLHPSEQDPGWIILLLVVHREGKSRMVWYEWSSVETLRTATLKSKTQVLGRHEQLPLLLVPLTKSSGFLLVHAKRMTMYRNILTGSLSDHTQHLDMVEDSEEPGSSANLPLWTQWARPMRPRWHAAADSFYLCREDGIVQYLELNNSDESTIDSSHRAGRLGVNVDTAFAILDVGPNTVDLLVAGGCGSEGGLWSLEPRMDPVSRDKIADIAPLGDLTVKDDPDAYPHESYAKTSATRQIQEHMLACMGTGKNGAISEVLYGLEAPVIQPLDLQNVIGADVLAVWAFHVSCGDVQDQSERTKTMQDLTYVVVTHPLQTSILALYWKRDMEDLDEWNALVNLDVQERIGLDYSSRTVFAGITRRGLLLQVTQKSIYLSSLPAPEAVAIKEEAQDSDMMDYEKADTQEKRTRYYCPLPNTSCRILAASMCTINDRSLLLTSVEREGHFYLQLGYLDTEYECLGEPWLMQSQPSCTHMQWVGSDVLAFVATVDGEIQIFRLDQAGLVLVNNTAVKFGTFAVVCDTMALLTSTRHDTLHFLLVCGLRNGSLQTFEMNGNDSAYDLNYCEEISVGTTSVNVSTDMLRKSRAIIHCEQRLLALEYPQDGDIITPAVVHNIWLSGGTQRAFQHVTVSALSQVRDFCPSEYHTSLTVDTCIKVSSGGFQIFKLSTNQHPSVVPRRLNIGGTPSRGFYSHQLGKIIVLYNKRKVLRSKRSNPVLGPIGERVTHPSIRFLDPDAAQDTQSHFDSSESNEEDDPSGNDEMLVQERKPTEKFLGITEWFPRVGEREFHVLILNTKYESKGKSLGRLLLFTTGKGVDGIPKLLLKRRIELNAPAYSVVAHPDGRSIVYCTGNYLCLQSIEDEQASLKWKAPIRFEMRSPARHLTVREPYIYVSSTEESLMVFKIDDKEFLYQYGDQVGRSGIHHVHLPEHSLVMASDMERGIVGLWQPPRKRIDNAMTAVFEATLPASMIRLRRVRRPPWYRNPLQEQGTHAVIGTSADGTIIQFDIIAQGWHLLRFIQNMAERNKPICPFIGIRPYKRHIDPTMTKPKPWHMHINGDTLQRVLDNGGEMLINEMLDAEPNVASRTDFISAEARRDKFRKLASEVIDVEEPEWLMHLVQWISHRLQSAL